MPEVVRVLAALDGSTDWRPHSGESVAVKMFMRAAPTRDGGRPVRVRVRAVDGSVTATAYAEAWAYERVSAGAP